MSSSSVILSYASFLFYSAFYALILIPTWIHHKLKKEQAGLEEYFMVALIAGLIYDNLMLGLSGKLYPNYKVLHYPRYLLHVGLLPFCWLWCLKFVESETLKQLGIAAMLVVCALGLAVEIPELQHLEYTIDKHTGFVHMEKKVRGKPYSALVPIAVVLTSIVTGAWNREWALFGMSLLVFLIFGAANPKAVPNIAVRMSIMNFGEILFVLGWMLTL